MLRLLAPAGTPLSLGQVLRGARASCTSPGDAEASLAALRNYLGVRYLFGISSGRAALCLILRCLHRLRPGRDVVAIPAYTCFSVAASVARAGLKLWPVEVNPETLDFDSSALDQFPAGRLLAIVPCSLFGLVNDMERVRAAADSHGAFVVDDAAQALGARWHDRFAGTLGDVGLYSLGRGKAFSTVEGGLIVTDSDELGEQLQTDLAQLPRPAWTTVAGHVFRGLATSVLLDPSLYWIPSGLPFLKLGVTEFDPGFSMRQISPLASSLIPVLLQQLESLTQMRSRNAEVLGSRLQGNSAYRPLRPGQDCQPNYARFPVMASTPFLRDAAVARLQQAGVGASGFYPSAICDIPGIAAYLAGSHLHCLCAESVARCLLTLPTHPYVTGQDLQRMTGILGGGQADAA